MNRILYSPPIWLTLDNYAGMYRRNRWTGNWQRKFPSSIGPSRPKPKIAWHSVEDCGLLDRMTGPEAPILDGICDVAGVLVAGFAMAVALYLALFL